MRTVIYTAAILVLLQIASAASALAGEVVQVKISDLAFTPAAITVRVGDTVEWVNGDFIDHTATAKGGEWDVMIVAGETGRLKLTEPGTVEYFCRFHPNMTATIHVVRE